MTNDLLPTKLPVSWRRAVLFEGWRDPVNGPSGGIMAGLCISPHWFKADNDKAGTLCDICFGWSDDYRHLYNMEE